MRAEFTAKFRDGSHGVKIKLTPEGVGFRLLRVRDKNNINYFVPYEVIYKVAAKLHAAQKEEASK